MTRRLSDTADCNPPRTPARHDPLAPTSAAGDVGRFVALSGLIWLVAAAAAFRTVDFSDPRLGAAKPISALDPNSAPWWEMSMLPLIGDALARRIEEFRRDVPVGGGPTFARVADLDAVRGIGPKTIQRIAPYLCFSRQRIASADAGD